MSGFEKKWSNSHPSKDIKRGNTNTEEVNDFVSKVVDSIIKHKKKDNKQKLNFGEAETFCNPRISNSDSKPKLYRINSINLEESGKDYDELQYNIISKENTSPSDKYSVN